MSVETCTFSPLTIRSLEHRSSRPDTLVVPLTTNDYPYCDIDLFEGGVVDEKTPYALSFEIGSTIEDVSTTLSVNEHDEMVLRKDVLPSGEDGTVHLKFVLDATNADGRRVTDAMRQPFMLTCGLARIKIALVFPNGETLNLRTPDIVALSGEWQQDARVAAMYEALLRSVNNQAAEWMFADHDELGRSPNFRDESTDWSADSFVKLVKGSERALSLLEHIMGEGWAAGEHLQETEGEPSEAIVPLSLLQIMGTQLSTLREDLQTSVRKTEALLKALKQMANANKGRFGGRVSIPAAAALEVRLSSERSWISRLEALESRVQDLTADFSSLAAGPLDDEMSGFLQGFLPIQAQRVLSSTLDAWEHFAGYELSREARALHTIKPDRLYEYYALWRLLGWFHEQGFTEDRTLDPPISRFAYTTAHLGGLYENEWRVAKTYHLTDGLRHVCLYYVPVVFGLPFVEENGITVHRTRLSDGKHVLANGFYTPDYLLFIDNGRGHKATIVFDAKYSQINTIGGIEELSRQGAQGVMVRRSPRWSTCTFNECLGKYRDHISNVDPVPADAMPDVSSVWLLCGRHGAEQGDVGPVVLDGSDTTASGVLALSTMTTNECLDQLFVLLDL
ncbi:MAG: hypothetical protein IKE22_09595 [Atopobiaceae bacterium]|nr:hypothetical protein [Atopobiaceae bacterium]